MSDEQVLLTVDEAIAILSDGDEIKAYQQAGSTLFYVPMPRSEALNLIRQAAHREWAGPNATEKGYALAVYHEGVTTFLAARPPERWFSLTYADPETGEHRTVKAQGTNEMHAFVRVIMGLYPLGTLVKFISAQPTRAPWEEAATS